MRTTRAVSLALALFVLGGCTAQSSQPSLQAGNGLQDHNNTLSVDSSEVPVVPTCAAGQVVGKGANGWECFTPMQPDQLKAGSGISIEGGTINFDASSVPASDVWNGTVPYSRVTGAPDVAWSTVDPTVMSTDQWPGTVDYSHIQNAPLPYTDAQAAAAAQTAVTWSTVAPTVPPGGISNSMLASPSFAVNAVSPLTGGGSASLGGTVSLGLGTVTVSNGGTGQTSWPAGGVVTADGSGLALHGVAPGATGNVLTSTGSAWQSQPVSTAGLARITTGPLTLYVRPNGDDTACDGTADVDAGAAAPACALGSLQHAIDVVPDIIRHAVVINLAAGTYYAPSGASSLVTISKEGRPDTGSILIVGSGSVILSGGSAGAPGTPVTGTAVALESTSIPVTIRSVSMTGFNGDTVSVSRSHLTLDGVTIQSSGSTGLLCLSASFCETTGTTSISGAGSYGIGARYGSKLTVIGGSLTTSGNAEGVYVDTGSRFLTAAPFTSKNNTDYGLRIWYAGLCNLEAAATFSGNGSGGIDVEGSSGFTSSAGLAITADNGNGIQGYFGADVHLTVNAPISITCNGSNNGIAVTDSSTLIIGGPSSLTISGCNYGIEDWNRSGVTDYGSGMRSVTGMTANVDVDFESTYVHGNLPIGSCGQVAYCR